MPPSCRSDFDDVIIGAGSVETKDITTPGTDAGNPARRLLTSR
ncbi:hypothetical protein [Bradyrhizobium barranii]|nr:hypothetical protein [Bradyrhizobium barranii]